MRRKMPGIELKRKDIDYYLLLCSAPLLLTAYLLLAGNTFYPGVLSATGADDLALNVARFAIFFVLLLGLPFLHIVISPNLRGQAMGLGFGDWRLGLRLVLLLIPFVIVPALYIGAQMPAVRAEYPLARILLQNQEFILLYETAYVLLYYTAWEFYFRGYLLFGLATRFGAANAILIQTISSALIHIGKPEGELIGSIVVGVLFGLIAWRTRSIWYVFLLHAAIGVATDLWIIYG
jgi:membrane protease YdiL (CAAX protease family)